MTQTERITIANHAGSDLTSDEVADYIADMLLELSHLAKTSGLSGVSTMLDLAEQEARTKVTAKGASGSA